ncbi:PASTA domain-containing protein [Conexibacter sp. JD483]|uniref:PASTA domain-containing protein n=1 Tax=unclassified Conexibacter TaxID=2627773 RepID=UPI00272460E8|nr:MULTISPECIES: PASTA domain-containing protein [unclassified Conexibacter]MDO8186373.1 PASTA domain-containing protein [Conexibacter sp. CPCC 205706]MDO8199772.1 PASTA domain-containing protein [Conexibacter sp. CPCC 205762]MDR9371135.1 PASTA domain-containing protein [Conexibacter sp. JD483]
MRRTLPLALLALAVAPAAAQAADSPGIAPGEPNPATPVAVDWRLDQAGRDARSLDLLAFGSSSCLPGSLSAAVVETRARIEISVRTVRPSGQLCTDDYVPVPLTVQLRAPPRGRLVVGPRRLRSDPLDGRAPGRRRVPRVTGLAPRDAVAVVRQHGLAPQLEHVADLRSRPRVIGQTPASGRSAARRAPVTLFVSR